MCRISKSDDQTRDEPRGTVMKIVCDDCGTRTSLADERVKGEVLQIRCKKCRHISVVGRDRAAPEAPRPDAQVGDQDPTSMKGARHEESVLFSLANIQALGMRGKPANATLPYSAAGALGAGHGEPGVDASGLIDIRSMVSAPALATTGASASAGAVCFSDLGSYASPISAAPVMLPATAEQRPGWLVPGLLGVGGILLLTVIVLVVILTVRKLEPQVVAVPPSTPLPKENISVPPRVPDEAAEGLTDKAGAKVDTPEARINVTSKRETLTSRARSHRGRSRRPQKSRRETIRGVAVPLHQTAPRIAPKKGEDTKGEDPLNKLIDEAIDGKESLKRSVKRRDVSVPDPRLPRSIGKADIQRGMQRIQGRVRACYEKFRVSGTAMVKITISGEGRLSSALVRGRFAATPSGACIRTAVMAARFPEFSGSPIRISYPFMLQML